jgi:zinc protease
LTGCLPISKLFFDAPQDTFQRLRRRDTETLARGLTRYIADISMKQQASRFLSTRFIRLIFAFSLLLAATSFHNAVAQHTVEPRREQLLNGLNLLLWQRPADPSVVVKLRIYSGAAFDMTNKAGTMALLGDALFSDPSKREYFTEDLGGRLDVTTDYDSINVTLSGRATQFEKIIDELRVSILNIQLTPEVVARLREARIKLARDLTATPTSTADRAIAARLFGDFPYGRFYGGTPETLSHIERADLLLARDRFLNPNNSTLAIVGGVDERRAIRTVKQLLGLWRKSEATAPSTFRQPEAPDARPLIIDYANAETAEIRLAVRGLSRSDRDYAAATLLALLARDRWQASLPAELNKSAFFVRHEAHVLPGIFVMGASAASASSAKASLAAAQNVIRSLMTTPPTPAELEKLKSEAIATLNKQIERPETVADAWLDAGTFQTPPLADQLRALSSMTIVDVQGVAAKLFRNVPVAAVAVGNAAQLQTELASVGQVEVFGETKAVQPAATKGAQPAPTLVPGKESKPTSTPTPKRP